MKLDQVSNVLRVAGEAVRAGEQIVDRLASSRRSRLWPLLLGVGVGVGVGVLVFDDKTRERVKNWMTGVAGRKPIRVEPKPAAAPPPDARPS